MGGASYTCGEGRIPHNDQCYPADTEMWNLIRYHFTLAISFDGPPEENDKYRVFKNGQGTGTVVERALDMIREISEEYLLNHVHIQAVLDSRI